MRRLLPIVLLLACAGALAFALARTLAPPAEPGGPRGAPGRYEDPRAGPAASAPGELRPAEGGSAPGDAIPKGTLAGLVRKAGAGTPIEGATVRLHGGEPKVRDATTDAGGAYRFEGLAPGDYQASAFSARYADSAPLPVKIAADAVANLDIEISAGAAVHGTVTDRQTGAVLSGVKIVCPQAPHRTATTGSDGLYRIEGLAAGQVYFTAEGDEWPMSFATVLLAGPETEALLDFALTRGATVSGTVTDAGGAPVAEAVVSAAYGGQRQVKTTPDGSFRLRGVPAESQIVVTAAKTGYATAMSEPLLLHPGEEMSGLRLALSAGARVRGVVVNADGTPAAGVTISAMARGEARPVVAPSARTDAKGAFDLFPMPPGDWQLSVFRGGTAPIQREIGVIEEGQVLDGVEIRLGGGEAVAGVVVDAAGSPVSGAILSARPAEPTAGAGYASARTDGDGRFRLEGLPAGRYLVTVHSSRGAQMLTAEAATGATDLKLTVPLPGAIAGRVLLPGGEPAPAFTVRVMPDDPQRGGMLQQVAVKDASGAFHVAGVAAGEYAVSASGPQGFSETLRGVVVGAGQEAAGIVLTLRPGGTIRGRVVEGDGSPVLGARVMAMPARPGAMSGAISMQTSGSDGEFAVPNLEPGAWRVNVAADGRYAGSDEVELTTGGEVRVEIRFPRTGTLVVRVTDVDGRPVAGAWVAVSDAAGRGIPMVPIRIPPDLPPERRAAAQREAMQNAFRTDGAGICVREGAPEGRLTVRAGAAGYGDSSAEALLDSGGRAEVTIALPVPAGGSETEEKERAGR